MVDINDGDRVEAERVNAAPHADQERAAPQKYELLDSVLLMFSNKQNLSNAMSAAEMTDKLGLHGLCQQWFVLVYRATTSDRLYGGLDWLMPLSRRDS